MNISDIQELNTETFIKKQGKNLQKLRNAFCLSDSLSTNNCTTDLEGLELKLDSEAKWRKKHSDNNIPDVAERLNNLKQISENNIRFMRAEKEIKELAECTFKPKTNQKIGRFSRVNFSNRQIEYSKSKNSNLLKLQIRNSRQASFRLIETTKKNDREIFSRLYNESKLITRTVNRCN